MIDVGQSLRAHRLNSGLSQAALAVEIGARQQTITDWENNISFPSIENCLALAKFYGITVDHLVGVRSADGAKLYKDINDLTLIKRPR